MKENSLISRIPLWGKVAPLIAAMAALAMITTGAGITGDNPVIVQEPVQFGDNSQLLTQDLAVSGDEIFPGDGIKVVRYEDNTRFSATARTYPGDAYTIYLSLDNKSNARVIQRITIDAPDGFRFSGDICGEDTTPAADFATSSEPFEAFLCSGGSSAIELSQETANTFVAGIGAAANASDNNDVIRLNVEILNSVAPGFYTVEILLEQF